GAERDPLGPQADRTLLGLAKADRGRPGLSGFATAIRVGLARVGLSPTPGGPGLARPQREEPVQAGKKDEGRESDRGRPPRVPPGEVDPGQVSDWNLDVEVGFSVGRDRRPG